MAREERLLDLGTAVADGLAVDWVTEASTASEKHRPVVRELRLIAGIATAHRELPAPEVAAHRSEEDGTTRPLDRSWGHLKVLERTGQGGFGEVHRAWDTRLDREVALKLLQRSAFDSAAAQTSVIEEGRLLARVRHPNVATVFGAEQIDGQVGIWMEFIRGRTLEQLIRERGVFGAREAAGIGIDLCRALAAVHLAGLLHRDVKAQNVMREDGGRIVLMDLGTGREQALDAPGQDLAGTPRYLAPEILRGEAATVRSDIYALGVLLFRMVTDTFPTPGRRFDELRAAHRRGERLLLPDRRPDLPNDFVRIVEKALAPDPEARFQTAGEMESALSHALAPLSNAEATPRSVRVDAPRRAFGWQALAAAAAVLAVVVAVALVDPFGFGSSPTGPAPIRSIAVLPFANQSGDPSQDYIADGVTDMLRADLSNVRSLRVISRTSVTRYADTALAVPEIARELNVDAVVEGSVAREGAQFRLTVSLVRADGDTPVWSQNYQRDVAEVLTFQAEVAQAIASAVAVRLTPAEAERLAQRPVVNPAAQDAYLRGRHALNGFTTESVERGVDLLEDAVRLDPNYALAYGDLADAYIRLASNSTRLTVDESVARAKAAATAALALDPDLAPAHVALGRVRFYFEWDWDAAEASFLRALQVNPSHAAAHQHYAYYLAARGELDAAIEAARTARDLDPLATVRTTSVAGILYYARRYDEAIEELLRARDADPDFVVAHFGLGRAYAAAGRFDEAIASLERSLEPARDAGRLAELARVYAEAGRPAESLRVLDEATADARQPSSRLGLSNLACVHIALGNLDLAFTLLEQAADEHDPGLLWLKVDPRVDPIRDDARFDAIVKRLGVD